MENQVKFLEMLEEIKEIAKAQDNRITGEEIQKLLGENLTKEQMRAVYQYLGEHQIKVVGYTYVPDLTKSQKEEKTEDGKKKESRKESNMRLYRQEILGIDSNLDKEIIAEYLKGNTEYRNKIIESRLSYVMELAQKYQKREVSMDDVIAEGNMGLMQAMTLIEQEKEHFWKDEVVDLEEFCRVMDREIVKAMETYIDEITDSRDWENTVLAKTNLLHEATKYMTEEIGRVPTIEELSEYTKISRREIKDIMGLSEDAKRVAEPKIDEKQNADGRELI